MKQSAHRSHTKHRTHSSHRSLKKRFRIKFFDRFKRFDEYGFVNPEYDKIHITAGKITMSLIAVIFIVLLVLCYLESFPSNVVY